ncbi:MAG: RDD family protein [Actinomycetota bacterium]
MTDFPPPNERSDQLATLGRRALAQVVDGFVVGIPLFLLTLAWGGDLTDANNDNLVALTALWLGVNLFYNTAMIATRGATIGKRMVRIKVVNRIDGSAVSWSYAAVRALIPAVAGLIPAIGFALNIAVYIRAFFHPYRQGLHDAAAGTVVVRA